MKIRIAGVLFFAAACMSLPASAAEPEGTLRIKIVDSFDTPVQGAKIKAVRIVDQKTFQFTSDDDGGCKPAMPVGTYCITVRAPTFKPDFTGGVVVRAETEFPVRFALYPGDMNEKLPHEKTPAERAEELAKLQARLEEKERATAATVMAGAYEGLDEACETCGIKRTHGGPAARNEQVAAAVQLIREKQYGEALEKYKQALGEDASDPIIWFNAGVLFSAQRQSGPAEACFKTAIGLCGGGGDALYHAYLGRAYGRQGRLKEAENCYKAATLIDPSQKAQFTYELANAYHSMKRAPEAVKLYKQAIDEGCTEASVYFGYANALEMQRKNGEAVEQYRRFIEKAADDPALAQHVGLAKQKIEKLSK